MNVKKILAIALAVSGIISLILAAVVTGPGFLNLSNIARIVFIAAIAAICAVVSAVFWILGNKQS